MRSSGLQCLVNRFWAARAATNRTAGSFRSFAAAAEGSDALPKEIANEQNVENRGAKAVLFDILRGADGAMTTAQIWETAEGAGVKSKRFMKQMLLQMKKARHIKSLKEKGASHFGYILPEKIPPPPPLPERVVLKLVKARFVKAAA